MIQDTLDAVHVVLENVHGNNVGLRLDRLEEWAEPLFVLLHSHTGRDELGTSLLMRSEPLLPRSSSVRDRDHTGRARAGEVGLVEAHDKRSRTRLELLECLETRPVIVMIDTAKAPEHWYGKDAVAVRVVWVRSPVVVPSERFRDPLERVAASDTCFALGRSESRD